MSVVAARVQTAPQDHPYVEVFTEIEIIEHHLRAAVTRNLPPGMTRDAIHRERDGLVSLAAPGWDLVTRRMGPSDWFPPSALAEVTAPLVDFDAVQPTGRHLPLDGGGWEGVMGATALPL